MSISCGLSEKKQDYIVKRKLSVLPLVIDIFEAGKEDILWVDEAVFSTT